MNPLQACVDILCALAMGTVQTLQVNRDVGMGVETLSVAIWFCIILLQVLGVTLFSYFTGAIAALVSRIHVENAKVSAQLQVSSECSSQLSTLTCAVAPPWCPATSWPRSAVCHLLSLHQFAGSGGLPPGTKGPSVSRCAHTRVLHLRAQPHCPA